MLKFENVDVLDSLEKIMKTHTESYQSDFEYDKRIIREALQSNAVEDRNLLWLSRLHGTHCLYERDVFIKDTPANITWKFWSEQKDENPLTYAVAITGAADGKVIGNLYQIDFREHIAQVQKNAVKADNQVAHYENGDVIMDFGKWFSADDHKTYGKYVGLDYLPNEPDELDSVLRDMRKDRNRYQIGDIQKHIADLESMKKKPSIKRQLAKSEGRATPTPPAKQKTNELEV